MQTVSSISPNIMSSIPTLNVSNFWEWTDCLMIALDLMGHDLPFIEDRPTISNSSTNHDRSKLERWETSNRMCLMLIKHYIPSVFRGIVPDEVVLAKDYLVALEKSFAKNGKAETITFLADLASMSCWGRKRLRQS